MCALPCLGVVEYMTPADCDYHFIKVCIWPNWGWWGGRVKISLSNLINYYFISGDNKNNNKCKIMIMIKVIKIPYADHNEGEHRLWWSYILDSSKKVMNGNLKRCFIVKSKNITGFLSVTFAFLKNPHLQVQFSKLPIFPNPS